MEVIEFSDGLEVSWEGKGTNMVPRFLAQAAGKMKLSLTEMGTVARCSG